ncbi:histone deacetylase 11 isoform X3 [Tachypleus tridentatus]|uniref:histone deacetylase 11 isoform X3 n=1 Tax=Tachypleus tridentatus TaxID=6853 RepID=UPI003FCFC4E9
MGKLKILKCNSMREQDKDQRMEHSLYFDISPDQIPIIYASEYNITFGGLEKVHPFDAAKWHNVHTFLKDASIITDTSTVSPKEATDEDLMVVHPQSYLNKLKAGKLALERNWAINIGGGFHHCSREQGGGFCAYADITLCIQFLLRRQMIQKAMIVDLDAHQGNGHERDFLNERNVYILDIYNGGIYPGDVLAKDAIKRCVELRHRTKDAEYLEKVDMHLEGALNEFQPDIIVYNAGTDILEGDPLGCLSITPKGIIERDEIVFRKAKDRNIPIVMLTSGGYQHVTARVIADSIINLHHKGYLT